MSHLVYQKSKFYLDNLVTQGPIGKYLQRLRSHHDDSYDHSLRVARTCVDLGYENELPDRDIRTLGYAGLLHDLGKTSVDASVLSKPSALSPEERQEVEGHPRLGYLQLEEQLFRRVKRVVAGHHEFQTAPFPRSNQERRINSRSAGQDRRGDDSEIIRLTQIVAIADMFDALSNARSYKDGLSRERTLEILFRQFTGDPLLIDQVMRRF